MKKQLFTIIFFCATSISQAQLHEVGIFVGGTNYVGDIGKTNYISPNKLAGGIVYKRNMNTRIALRGTLSYLPIAANDTLSTNSFRKDRGYKFKNDIIELAVGIEYNFFEYDIKSSDKTFTPYIFLESAISVYNSTEISVVKDSINVVNSYSNDFVIPFGLGFKIKLIKNITLALETKVRYTFKDNLDSNFRNNLNNSDPNFIDPNSINTLVKEKKLKEFRDNTNGNGNDWYMFTGFSFIYTFGKPEGEEIWFPK